MYIYFLIVHLYVAESVKSQYEAIIDIVSNYISSTKVALLKFSLALRAYSPAVEAFHQVSTTGIYLFYHCLFDI